MPEANSPKRLPARIVLNVVHYSIVVLWSSLRCFMSCLSATVSSSQLRFAFLCQTQIPQDLVMVYIDNQTKKEFGPAHGSTLDRRFSCTTSSQIEARTVQNCSCTISFDAGSPDPNRIINRLLAMRDHGPGYPGG